MTVYRTAWYGYTAPASGPVTISAGSRDGVTSVKLDVFTGSTINTLTPVGTGTGAAPQVTFTATSGVTYRVRVAVPSDVEASYWLTGTGPVPPTPPPPPAATAGKLPFDAPAVSTLRAAGGRAFGHIYPAMPLRIDNVAPESDYWTVYLNPNGEYPKFVASGGWTKDRPVKLDLIAAPTTIDGVEGWRVEAAKHEIKQMIAAGWDGGWMNTMSYGNTKQVSIMRAYYVAAKYVDPGFQLAPMIDINGVGSTVTIAMIADWVDWCMDQPNAAKLADGRKLLGSFKAEGKTPAWWASLVAAVEAKGHSVALILTFNALLANRDAYASLCYGQGEWGDAWPSALDPTLTTATSRVGRGNGVQAKNGKGGVPMKYSAFLRVEEERPREFWFVEPEGSTVLLRTHEIARNIGAEWYQLISGHDYTEGTHMLPSDKSGWGRADLNLDELIKTKTGSYATIVRDCVMLIHRLHPWQATPTFPQTPMKLRANTTPARDKHEIRTWLTAAARITVTAGSVVTQYTAPAGRSSRTIDLQIGALTAVAERLIGGVWTTVSGTEVTSPHPVVAKPYLQNLMYVFISSLRNHANRALAGG